MENSDIAQISDPAGKTILLADADQFIAVAFRHGLERAGYIVIVTHDGEEALALAESARPDLILLDLILPKINGFEVLERLKQSEELQSIPVIVLTSLSQPSDEAEARSYGIADFLDKSDISLRELLTRLQEIL